jgi:hypothetical protein
MSNKTNKSAAVFKYIFVSFSLFMGFQGLAKVEEIKSCMLLLGSKSNGFNGERFIGQGAKDFYNKYKFRKMQEGVQERLLAKDGNSITHRETYGFQDDTINLTRITESYFTDLQQTKLKTAESFIIDFRHATKSEIDAFFKRNQHEIGFEHPILGIYEELGYMITGDKAKVIIDTLLRSHERGKFLKLGAKYHTGNNSRLYYTVGSIHLDQRESNGVLKYSVDLRDASQEELRYFIYNITTPGSNMLAGEEPIPAKYFSRLDLER